MQSRVAITGISGRFPESSNVNEFAENLYNHIDMVTENSERWPPGLYDLPKRIGILKDIDRIDAQFFNLSSKQVENMDPQLRIMLECVYEAVVDSGFNPKEIRGTRTGVFMGISFSDAHIDFGSDSKTIEGYAMTGCTKSMLANRVSYFFDLRGPSQIVDTACSSTMMALYNAVRSMEAGECDQAIVGGAHLLLRPQGSLQFKLLNMLSPDGKCKSFDQSANGYARAETIGAIFLQPISMSRRMYAEVVDIRSNTDGFKSKGITFPNGDMQQALMDTVYKNAKFLYGKERVVYYEAHGTGTQAGDPEEMNAAAEIYCENTVGNNTSSVPFKLLIGSVKSNAGHSEPSSGIAALCKVLITIQNKSIPANLHFFEPNKNINGLEPDSGKLKVVCSNTPLPDGMIALNSSGFGGSNVHTILRPTKPFGSNSAPQQNDDDRPLTLIIFSGRTRNGVEMGIEYLRKKYNIHFHKLLQPNLDNDIYVHPYRGYGIFKIKEDDALKGFDFVSEITEVYRAANKRPVWFVYTGMGCQWPKMARELFKVNKFREYMEKCREILQEVNIDLFEIIFGDCDNLNRVSNVFVAIAAVQIALTDCLHSLNVKPDNIIGHSVGEIACAYADGCFSARETLLTAYYRGICIENNNNLGEGAMAAVGLSWDECLKICPNGVVPACHNSENSVTISGDRSKLIPFVDELRSKNVFAKVVNSCSVAFHSPCMQNVVPDLQAKLKSLLGDNPTDLKRKRSEKWLSTSIDIKEWSHNDIVNFSSAEYHINNLYQRLFTSFFRP